MLISNTYENESGIIFRDYQDVSGYQKAKIMFNSATADANELNFYIGNSSSPRLTIGYSGKIGIGTKNFSQPVAVASPLLYVNGGIVCKGIDVRNVAADYVFQEDYQLKTLPEVEKFIKNNKHLPDIPSAQVTSKGVELSSFSSLLLQKIEELTLYAIEQQKEIEKLKLENEKIKSILNTTKE